MTILEKSKQAPGSALENIFFRPMLTGESAQDLGTPPFVHDRQIFDSPPVNRQPEAPPAWQFSILNF